MPKSFSPSATDRALEYISTRATRLSLCVGAPADAAAATTPVSGGGVMLGDLQLATAADAVFAIATAPDGSRRLTIGGQTEVIGHEDGVADHLAVIDTANAEILVLTELTEDQPVLPAAVIATRSFSVTLGNP